MIKMKFLRKDSNKKKRLNKGYRRPKGLHNKMRLEKKGHSSKIKPGFGRDNKEKNTWKGLKIVFVEKLEDLKGLDPKKHSVNIKKISKKSKVEIVKEAKKKGFVFVNLNAEAYLKSVEELLKQKSSKTKKQKDQPKEEKEESKKKESDSEKKEPKVDPEEKKKQEKKKQEEIITKGR